MKSQVTGRVCGIKWVGLSLFAVGIAAQTAWAVTPVQEIIRLDKPEAPKYELTEPDPIPEASLKAHLSHTDLVAAPEDKENLDRLWQGVIQRNPVIQYSLKQLATPPELRYGHNSLMSRTLSGLLNGAAMLPYTLGADQYTAGASVMGANLIDRAMAQSKQIDPNQLPSDTELVQLSGVVQSLQEQVLRNYQDYKDSLMTLSQQPMQTVPTKNSLGFTVNSLWTLVNQQEVEYTNLLTRHTADRAALSLERLVGPETMKQVVFKEMSALESLQTQIQVETQDRLTVQMPQIEALWRERVRRDPTLQLALQKLAEKTGQWKPDKKAAWTHNLLQQMIQLGGLGGAMMTGSPAPMVGSAVLGRMAQPTKASKRLTTVTSADLVILAREIEEAQRDLILVVLAYRETQQDVETLQQHIDVLQDWSKQRGQVGLEMTDMLHNSLLQKAFRLQQVKDKARANRQLLVLYAGETAVTNLDQALSPAPQTPSSSSPELERESLLLQERELTSDAGHPH